ncbi:recombinase family protein [Enterococcus sp. 22-H-5-01]|uniref:recombinase family protein n=1 Tax=Enterococcus sp. 22-H-5-01 TaxID=3418555 RepID=UPI003CFD981F
MVSNTEIETSKNRAAIYTRVSTNEQAEEGHSIEAQQRQCRAKCADMGLEVTTVYADEGISGKKTSNRPQLQKMMEDARQKKFDYLVIWKISRLSRSMMDLLNTNDELAKHDVSLVAVSDNFDLSSISGKMTFQLLGAFAEFERETIASNVKMSMTSLVRDKKRPAGGRRLGYVSGVDQIGRKCLIVQEDEAEIVRLIFEKYLSGSGYKAIANFLNRQGYMTVKGNAFSTTAVKGILHNYKTYNGFLVYNRYEHWESKRRKGKNANPIIVQGDHEKIIDDFTAKKIELRLSAQSFQPKWNNLGGNLLTGLLKCPQCGAPMAASNTTNTLKDGTKRRIRYYVCSRFRNEGASVCHANSIKADMAENFVAERLKEVVTIPSILEKTIEKLNDYRQEQISPLEQELATIALKKETIQAKLKKWYELLEEDNELLDSLIDRINELKKDLALYGIREEEILSILNNKDKKLQPKDIHILVSGIDRMLENQPKPVIKNIYRSFVKSVTFDPTNKENITITMNFSEEIVEQINELYKKTASFSEDAVFLHYVENTEISI